MKKAVLALVLTVLFAALFTIVWVLVADQAVRRAIRFSVPLCLGINEVMVSAPKGKYLYEIGFEPNVSLATIFRPNDTNIVVRTHVVHGQSILVPESERQNIGFRVNDSPGLRALAFEQVSCYKSGLRLSRALMCMNSPALALKLDWADFML